MSPQIGMISCPGFTWCRQGNKLDSASTRPPVSSPAMDRLCSPPWPPGHGFGRVLQGRSDPTIPVLKNGALMPKPWHGPFTTWLQHAASLLTAPQPDPALNFSPLVEGDGHLHLSQTFVPIAPLTWVLDLSLTNTCSSFSIMNKYHILSRASHHFSKQSSLFQAAYAYFDHFLQSLKWHLNIFTQYV